MFARFVIFFIVFSFSFELLGQTLSISAAASSGSYSISGTNPVTILATGTANISTTDIQTQLNAGNSVIIRSTAGTITQSAAISKSSGAAASLTYMAEGSTDGSITISSNISSTSNALNLVLWSNFSSSTGTGVSLSNSTITTNGGHFYVGGGAASETVNSLTVPTGYTNSTTHTSHGIGVNTCNINTNGGTIRMRGSVSATDGSNAGIHLYGTTSVSSGSGSLSLFGQRTGNPNASAGLFIGSNISASVASGNVSISSTSGAIYLEGTSANTTNSFSWNHGLAIVEYGGDDVTITSTTGNITLNGDATNAAGFVGEAVGFVIQSNDPTGLTQITTDGGHITIIGKSGNSGNNFGSSYRAGNAVGNIAIGDANTGNVTLRFGSLSTNVQTNAGRVAIQGIGNCVVEGIDGAAFASAIELTTAYSFGSALASLRVGSSSNTQNVTLTAATTIAGDIDIYAGTITLSNNLTTTNNGDISFYTNNAIGGLTAQRNVTAAGVFSYIPQGSSFVSAVTFPISNLNLSSAGLIIGNSTNSADITVAAATSISGPVTLYGGNINLNQNINTTGAAALGDVLCKASGEINLAASKSITTSGGDVILWANSDNANSTGSVALRSGSSIVTGSNSVTGGHVWIGGGSDGGTWNGLSVGAGYAVPGPGFMPTNGGGPWAAGVFFESCSITTFGGDVKILGDAASSGRGLICFGSVSIQTNAGDIEIEGNATNSALGNVSGILFGLHDNFTIGNVSLSSSASGTAIKVSGFGRGTENAIGLSGTLTALSTGTGNIVFNGTSYGTGTAINIGNYYNGILNAYAASGSITFNGGVKGLQVSVAQISGLTTGSSKLNIGQGGGIGSSTSAVILTGDALSIAADGIAVNTSGPLTIQPFSNSFTNALTYPITGLTVANTITGLTLGKTTNASSITMNAATINGPITAYGGAITVSGALSAAGNILLDGDTGNFLTQNTMGVHVNAALSTTSASNGNITIHGRGGSGSGYSGNHGILVSNLIETGGTGNIQLVGFGGLSSNGISGSSHGVNIDGSNAWVKSNGGNITINGNGGGAASGSYSQGVTILTSSKVSTANSGTIAITGTGGVNNVIGLRGLVIINSASVFSAGGAIQLTGIPGSLGTDNSDGVTIDGATIGSNSSGPITITGTAGGGVGSDAISMANSYSIANTIGGTTHAQGITLKGNNLALSGTNNISTTGQLTIEPTGNSFTSAIQFPITNLTVSNTITGLTLGKSTNTAAITVGSATSINGPISIYGGALTLSAALSATNATNGNMSLNGTTLSGGSLSVANGRTLTFNLSTNTTYAGAITGTGLNVNKDGAGILTLTGSNTPNFATLTISGGTYRLNSSQELTLSGALTNNGTFAMSDGATFKQATTGTSITGTGTYVVEKALTGNSATWNTTTSGRFWYMGVPMNSVARSSFGNYDLNTNRLFSYSENTKQYTNITDNAALLSKGTGYVHRRSTDGTLTFSAAGSSGLYAEDLTLSGLTRTSGASVGFHLISNPYMGYLDWHAITKNNVESTYYIRSNNAGSDISALITYNGSNQQLTHNTGLTLTAGQMQYLAPLQAVWVRVGPNSGTGSLAMTRSMVSHQTGNTGLKTSTIFPTLARVNLVDGARFDQMLVFMNQDMVNGVDAYDSEKMFVSGNPQIYTMAAGKKLVMNGLNSNKKKISVPVYLELPESKVYNLQLADYNLEDGLILLEDKQEGTIQDFTIHDTYAFYANSGVLQNRFVLHFFMPDATITAQGPSNSWVAEEGSYTEGGNILISSDPKGKVQISLDQPETEKVEGTVQVSDANGRVVYIGMLEGLATEFQLNVPSGIYYLTVQSGNLIENKKVFIQE